MRQILIICGPTATGKTSLGLKIAQKIPANLIAADSRQVYTHMDIGTGKDIPAGFKWHKATGVAEPGFYANQQTKLFGYDLISPDQEFSVSHFYDYATRIIKHSWSCAKLPVIIGGTGLYINSLSNPPGTIKIPPSPKLRSKLETLPVLALQKKLAKKNVVALNSMNQSDRNNPRRLIRAIEIASHQPRLNSQPGITSKAQTRTIGLTSNKSDLDAIIEKRVLKRGIKKFDHEVKKLIRFYPVWTKPAFTATGYKEWRTYLEGGSNRDTAISNWQNREKQYARRQLTWFNKIPDIEWHDLDKTAPEMIVAQVESWYAKS
jgi:tRNA dimethylallyltransferase